MFQMITFTVYFDVNHVVTAENEHDLRYMFRKLQTEHTRAGQVLGDSKYNDLFIESNYINLFLMLISRDTFK